MRGGSASRASLVWPQRPGKPEAVVGQAQDALASAIEGMRAAGQPPPGAVEEAGLLEALHQAQRAVLAGPRGPRMTQEEELHEQHTGKRSPGQSDCPGLFRSLPDR